MIGASNFKSLVLILLTPVDLLFEKLQIWSNTKSGVMASNLKLCYGIKLKTSNLKLVDRHPC